MHYIIRISRSEKNREAKKWTIKKFLHLWHRKVPQRCSCLLQTGRAGCSWHADPNSWWLYACRSVGLRTGKVQCPSRGGEGAAGGALAQHRDWSWWRTCAVLPPVLARCAWGPCACLQAMAMGCMQPGQGLLGALTLPSSGRTFWGIFKHVRESKSE